MKKGKQNLITVQLTYEDFRTLMHDAVKTMNNEACSNPDKIRSMDPTALEKYTLGILKELAHTYNLDEKAIQLNKRQAFPDIVAGEAYGVEVKQTKEDRWSSTGSSIVESTRSKGIDRIYLLFGKMGGNPEFKCRPYEECMEDIAVTHSPRYRINMELEPGQTIFDKMKISYEELRKKEDIIEPVRVYYKKRAQEKSKKEMPWWIGSPTEDTATNINLRLWSAVSSKEANDLLAQVFILFPEVLGSEFIQAALWLCTRHAILCHNVRDQFSAGGQYSFVNGNPQPEKIPHILGTFVNLSAQIKSHLYNPSEAFSEEIKIFHSVLLEGGHTSEERMDIYLKEVKEIVENKLTGEKDKAATLAEQIQGWFKSESVIS